MFKRKRVTETRYLTRDEQGRVELWIEKPTFIYIEDGESFFVDENEPENQISLDAHINRSISKMFVLADNTCLEIKVTISKKEVSVMPSRVDTYKKKDNQCLILL